MSLWTSADAVAATGGRSTAAWQADGVSIDTRTIRPGELFVALNDARDGHDCVAQALAADEWISEIGGVLSFKSKKFRNLIRQIESGEVATLVGE